MAQPTVVVLGGINMDLVAVTQRHPEAGETVVGSRFLTYPGGKGANQAVAAARMGARVRMVGRVGDDAFGRQLVEALAGAGVDVGGVAVDPDHSSGIASITVDAAGQNRIVQVLGANSACGADEVERARRALDYAEVVMVQLEVPAEVSLEVARHASSAGVVVILDPAPAGPVPAELYRHCGFITPNETEAQALAGFPVTDRYSGARAARALLALGPGCVLVKLGAQGVCYATGDRERHLPAFPVTAVDTVAAADAFNGAFAVALAEGADLDRAIEWAMAAGALAVTRTGAQDSMPRRREVEALLSPAPSR